MGSKLKVIAICVMALFTMLPISLTGCGGPSIEDLIREDLSAQLERLKNDPREVVGAMPSDTQSIFAQLGLDPDAYLDALFDGFDYSIDEIDVQDNTATAKVSVTVKSMDEINKDFETAYAEKLNSVDPTSIEDEDDVFKLSGQVLLDATAASRPKESTYEFTYSKNESGSWQADSSVINVIFPSVMP